MTKLDITPVLQSALAVVDSHRISDGNYSRWIKLPGMGERNYGTNAYGCADAANILYTLGKFPTDLDLRASFVKHLQAMQNPETGYFTEGSHHIIHTTAHCTAALELFDARPLHPFADMLKYLDIEEFIKYMTKDYNFLKSGKAAHAGAGIYASLSINGDADASWKKAYFDFFDSTCNPTSGLWEKNPDNDFTRRFQIGDSFHYYFNYGDFHRAIPYPEALIDSCLDAYKGGMFEAEFGRQFHFIEMDWLYCMNRASHQTNHRYDEIKETAYSFAKGYIDYLQNVDYTNDPNANDLHLLFGVMCALAELQKMLPEFVISDIPTRHVLDRRPFI